MLSFKCINKGCDKSTGKFVYQDFLDHLQSKCSTLKKMCPNKCKGTFNKKEFLNHYTSYKCTECAEVFSGCNGNGELGDMNDHACYLKH